MFANKLFHFFLRNEMKTMIRRVSSAMLVLVLLAVPSVGRAGQAILYDSTNTGLLKNAPTWLGTYTNTIYAGTAAAPETSDDTITVDISNIMAHPIKGVFGGLVYNQAIDANNNTVIIKNIYVPGSSIGIYGAVQSGTGSATNNAVTVSGGDMLGPVSGAQLNANAKDAINNSVTVTGGDLRNNVIGARNLGTGETTGNWVSIEGGTIYQYVYGAMGSGAGLASDNKIEISGGLVKGHAVGANTTGAGGASGNKIIITGGRLDGHAYGAENAGTGAATGNSVTLSGGSVGQDVFGVYNTGSSNISGNQVVITGGTVGASGSTRGIAGSFQRSSNSSFINEYNTVSISGATTKAYANVYGGLSNLGHNTNYNRVTLSGGAIVTGMVRGGENRAAGTVKGNVVEITSGAIVSNGVWGGINTINGTASENTVLIDNAKATGSVIGGESTTNGTASKNGVTLANGAIITGTVSGGAGSSGSQVLENWVMVLDGQVSQSVYGGHGYSNGHVNSNSVTMLQGSVTADVIGAYSNATGDTNLNWVDVSGGTVGGNLIGAFNKSIGDANENSVRLSGTALIRGSVFGGDSMKAGNTNQNKIFIEGGTVNQNVYAAYNQESGHANSNWVEMSGGLVKGALYGAYSFTTGNADSNTVILTGGDIQNSSNALGAVFGGLSEQNGSVSNNTVLIDGATIGNQANRGNVYGGWSGGNGLAFSNQNLIIMQSGTVLGKLTAGYATNGDATNNTVGISGGQVDGNTSDRNAIFGGYSLIGQTTNNKVFIDGGTIGSQANTGNVYGGWGGSHSTNNSIEMTDGTVRGALLGAYSAQKDVISNIVTINGGQVEGDSVNGGAVFGGFSALGNANKNTVSITNAQIGNNIYGGVGRGSASNAVDNTVSLFGPLDLHRAAIYGGFITNASGDAFTGNTLNANLIRSQVLGIHNFENYNFFVPGDLGNGQAMFTVTGSTPTDINNTHVAITGVAPGGVLLRVGDRIILIDKAEGSPASFAGKNVPKGAFTIYDFEMDLRHDLAAILVGIYPDPDIKPKGKVLSEGRLAQLALLGQGGDLAAEAGLESAFQAVEEQFEPHRAAIFGTMQGNTSRYEADGRIDLDGYSLITGLAWKNQLSSGELTVGPFFEAGTGRFDSHHVFERFTSNSDGNTSYYGGGLLARYEWLSGPTRNWYLEGSARAGRSDLEFKSTFDRHPVNYDSSAAYYSAHVGLGYVWNISEKTTLDTSTKFLWSRLDSDKVSVDDTAVEFKPLNSKRWRAGARLSHNATERLAPYVGAKYEYEFDGKQDTRVMGVKANSPALKGGTATGELGLRYTSQDGAFSADVSLQGYAGVRDGAGGIVRFQWNF